MNRKILFNDGWEFAKSGLDVQSPEGLTFTPVDLPHDWLIYNTLDLYENSIGWYRRKLNYTKREHEQVLLHFDGVYMDSSVYVNGEFVGEWKYGYSAFEHDITEALKDGDNEILVKVVHQSPNSRWYSGAGIYRNVWLKLRDRSHIPTDGIYVSAKKLGDGWDGAGWTVEIDTELNLFEDALLIHTLKKGDQTVAQVQEDIKAPEGGGFLINSTKLTVTDPKLWSPDTPELYQLVTELKLVIGAAGKMAETAAETSAANVQPIEVITTNIGFRHVVMDPNEGFILNGKKMKLNGVCEHHDLGALGAAFNVNALRRRFHILKDMGVNAIRTAHNMPAKELMDLADEMGFLVVSEAFDMWERPKTKYDYARFFPEWMPADVRSWVRRDRNHPSLIMWSIGNEIYDTHADERGQEITRRLMEEVLKHDPKMNARVTIGSNYMPWENAQKCADIVKIAGYNYGEKYYDEHHKEHPDWVIYGSETGSVVQSRGVYHFPYEVPILADDDEQCSALGNSTTSWGAKSTEACILAERDTPYSLGQFIWTGFDYIGEPTPYHTKNSYFGQIDTATFPKDSYYVYQSGWTDYKTNPMIHIFPYWDFNVGQIIDVRVASNAPKIELQLNGKTIGTFEPEHKSGTQLVGWWKVPYEPGELKAIAYDEEGKVIATHVRRSFGDAKKIRLQADKEQMLADGRDLIFLEISMEDEQGNPVENANNRVRVEVTGAGRLLGLDNGDSTDYDQYKGLSRRLFSGKLMAIIGATLEPGDIEVKVTSKGMEPAVIKFESLPAATEAVAGVTARMANTDMPIVMGSADEIPVRKIEIISESGQKLDPTKREIIVRAKLHPADASYQDVEWSVVNDAGIESNIAKVEANGLEAKITALGDGSFRVRCTSKNGTDKTKLISQLEFEATGLGVAYKDPYGFIAGGLYDLSRGEVGSGNERGVATARDGETVVGFSSIDFGPYGSDTITIPIFALSNEEYPIQIWEGMPGEEGSELLADVIYQKEPIWNVYQEETFRLKRRVKGIATISFVTQSKIHIKGFSFERLNRAFERNAAAESDRIYGDTFEIREDRVEGIGNNVSLEFSGMDFGEQGVSKIVICGHSPIDKNTIHIRFSGDGGESNQLVEFTQSDGYVERTFELERVAGMQKVNFIFLPGSNFNFAWFRFEA